MNNVTLVIPAYKPDVKLLKTVNDAIEAGFKDIIVVDDGSGKEYASIFSKIDAIPECVLLTHKSNKGKGTALKTAFAFFMLYRPKSAGVVTADADGQHLTKDILNVCKKMAFTGKIAIGCRDFSNKQVPGRSKFGNTMTRGVFRLFFGMKISDTQTGLRAFPRSCINDMLKIKGERYEYETQMLIYMSRNNVPFEEVKIDTVYIEENKSSHFRVVKDSIRIYSVIIKYLLSACLSTVVDEGAFFLFKLFPILSFISLPITFTAAFAARLISSLFNFFVNSKVVFDEKINIKAMFRYYLLVVVQISVSAASVFGLEQLFRVEKAWLSTLIKLIVDLILFFISFRVQHKWVFNTGKASKTYKMESTEAKEDKKSKKHVFRWVYIGFVVIMAVIASYCILYVHGLLKDYEAKQPERCVEAAMEELKDYAASPKEFWNKYSMPELEPGEFEEDIDVQNEYLALFSDPATDFALSPGMYAEDEMCYVIRNNDFVLAEVMLKAQGPIETKLAVFNTREWKLVSVTPKLEKNDYTITIPDDFTLCVNNIDISDEEGEETKDGEIKYTVEGVYLEPEFVIEDPEGIEAVYVVKNFRVLPEIYDYTLKLPYTLSVTINGEKSKGEEQDDGLLLHAIRQLDKPEVEISDLYGNTVSYEGGDLALTNMTILAYEDYTVKVDGESVPEKAVSEGISKEYEFLTDIVEDLPTQTEYSIAVLKNGAEVSVTNGDGEPVELKGGQSYYDLTSQLMGEDEVPAEVSGAVDVLDVAKKWSLFMSNDYTFDALKGYMLPDSYQYEVAQKYSTGVDRTFFSGHALLDPAFTDTEVSNFVWITEDSFSVDIKLVKHMRLNSGDNVDDEMYDRFYFVQSGGQWLLCGMKEVTENG